MDLGALRAWRDGRSYWRVHHRSGAVLCEWQGTDWAAVVQRGIVRAELVCPNRQVAVLDRQILAATRGCCAPDDLDGRLFQFKAGSVSTNPAAPRVTSYQALGMLTSPDGDGVLFAWEYGPRRLVGPLNVRIEGARLIGYGGPETGALSLDRLGVR